MGAENLDTQKTDVKGGLWVSYPPGDFKKVSFPDGKNREVGSISTSSDGKTTVASCKLDGQRVYELWMSTDYGRSWHKVNFGAGKGRK